MDNFIKKSIEFFCKCTDELKINISERYQIIILDDIYEFVFADDESYAKRLKNTKDSLYGLFYVTKGKELFLLIKKEENLENMLVTVYHEVVHIYDYIMLEENRNIHNFRKLQDDIFFKIWSEFHADYLSYKYIIHLNKNTIDPLYVTDNILNDLGNYYDSSPKLDVKTMVDITVRLYGRYVALQNIFPRDLNKYIKQLYYDNNFLNIYIFLWEHRNFESIIKDMDIWVDMLKLLEK